MYNTKCELRSTYGSDRDDESEESTATGTLLANFVAKVIRVNKSTDFVGTGTVTNDLSLSIIAPKQGFRWVAAVDKEVIPSAHRVIINGVGHIVSAVVEFGNKLRISLV